MNAELRKIQNQIDSYHEKYGEEASVGELSDGDHSFKDLYKHRTILLALAMFNMPYSWKAKMHEDGTMFDDMFITGFPTAFGMVSYHCNMEYWNYFKVPEIPHAPHFDGYTDKDVLDRLMNTIKNSTNTLLNAESIHKINDIVNNLIIPTFEDDENFEYYKYRFLGSYVK